MAKNYKDNFKDANGVWRTVGGRRIFIRNGQDLASAMIESGKFKNLRSDYKKAVNEEKEKYKPQYKSVLDRYEKDEKFRNMLKDIDLKNRQDAQNDIKEYLNGNQGDWEEGDFIRDLASEYNLELDDAKAMFNVMKADKDARDMQKKIDTNTNNQGKLLDAVKTSFLYKDEGEMASGLQKNYELYGKENVDSALKYYEDNYELIKGVASDSEGLTYNDLIKKDEYPENALKYYKNQMEELKNSGLQYRDSKAYNDKADALKEELEKSKDEAKQKYEDIFTPKPEDWEDINHWYNDDPREEWDKAHSNIKDKLIGIGKENYDADKEVYARTNGKYKSVDDLVNNVSTSEKDNSEFSIHDDYISTIAPYDDTKYAYASKQGDKWLVKNPIKGEYNTKEFNSKEEAIQEMKSINDHIRSGDTVMSNEGITKHYQNEPRQANTNNQELYNKYMKDADNYDKMKADYDKQEEAYKKEHDKLSDEWRKHKYGTPEYDNAYKKLTEHSNQHYNETKDMRDKLFKQKEIKALEEQGEKVVFDSKGNLLFHPSYYDKNATRKIDFGIDVNSPTAIKDKEILDSVTGQLSDGIWENSPGQDKYWSNINYEQHNNKITFATNPSGEYNVSRQRYINNPFSSKTDQEVKDYVANKIKQIAKIEMKDDPNAGTWDRNNTSRLNYLGYNEGITVADAYNLYDRLKGRTPRTSSGINDDLRRKAYQKYLKEHPNSKKTFDDFMK